MILLWARRFTPLIYSIWLYNFLSNITGNTRTQKIEQTHSFFNLTIYLFLSSLDFRFSAAARVLANTHWAYLCNRVHPPFDRVSVKLSADNPWFKISWREVLIVVGSYFRSFWNVHIKIWFRCMCFSCEYLNIWIVFTVKKIVDIDQKYCLSCFSFYKVGLRQK